MLLIPSIVALVQSNGFIVNCAANVDKMMQSLCALVSIELILERLAHCYCMPSRLACSRIIISILADMLMPDFSASANKSRLASRVSVMLVESFLFIPLFYHKIRCDAMSQYGWAFVKEV